MQPTARVKYTTKVLLLHACRSQQIAGAMHEGFGGNMDWAPDSKSDTTAPGG